MKFKYILGTAAAVIPSLLFAKGNITGKVFNKSTGEPMDFVTIQLLDKNGKPLAIGTSTDLDGNFILQNVNDGNYILKVSNIGSVDQERPIVISGENITVPDIRLADDAKLLQEVVVEGVKSQMRFELDRKVFQVDANVTVAGTSASELLESIPSVEVDQDGEVSLRGNSSVTIWINGKESGLTADNRAQILEQIPAETIERVEVITNPSAKYSPEGTAGIINIVLKKDRRAGYFGSAANATGCIRYGFSVFRSSSAMQTACSGTSASVRSWASMPSQPICLPSSETSAHMPGCKNGYFAASSGFLYVNFRRKDAATASSTALPSKKLSLPPSNSVIANASRSSGCSVGCSESA